MFKKKISVLLCFLMFFSLINVTKVKGSVVENKGNAIFHRSSTTNFKNEDLIRVLIKFKDNQSNISIDDIKATALEYGKIQEQFKKFLVDENISFDQKFSFNYIINGLSGFLKFKDVKKILKNPSVEFVEEIEKPETHPDEKDSKYNLTAKDGNILSNSNVNSNSNNQTVFPQDPGVVNPKEAWKKGYDGNGQLIAIIDSGIDPDHPDLKTITDINSAAIKSEADLNKKKDELSAMNIEVPGKYFNQKVVYGYNYKDGMASDYDSKQKKFIIKEELSKGSTQMHGTHVSGIASGNGTLKGVAPEAQLLFMRVLPEAEISSFIPDEVYIKAIEDAVVLGADTINLSLSSASVSKKKIVAGISSAIEKATKKGCVVNIAAGNDSYFGFGASKPRADIPDYGIIGSPAVHNDSLSVASVNNKVKYLKII